MSEEIEKDRGIPIQCWRCWWREGGRCYSKAFGPIPDDPEHKGFRKGREINDYHFGRCTELGAYTNKRAYLERVIPGDKLVIISEKTVKKEAKP